MMNDNLDIEAPMTKWREISTAPMDGSEVVVRSNSDVGVAEFTNGRWVISPTVWEGGDETGGLADLPFTPTHWILKTELLNL